MSHAKPQRKNILGQNEQNFQNRGDDVFLQITLRKDVPLIVLRKGVGKFGGDQEENKLEKRVRDAEARLYKIREELFKLIGFIEKN